MLLIEKGEKDLGWTGYIIDKIIVYIHSVCVEHWLFAIIVLSRKCILQIQTRRQRIFLTATNWNIYKNGQEPLAVKCGNNFTHILKLNNNSIFSWLLFSSYWYWRVAWKRISFYIFLSLAHFGTVSILIVSFICRCPLYVLFHVHQTLTKVQRIMVLLICF